jgi:hypothetical protein
MVVFGRHGETIYSTIVTTSLSADSARTHLEFTELRATIRQRGTARVVLLPVTFAAWGALAIAAAAVITVTLSTLVPLLVLAAGFEAVFALHVNVERLGRYLQVFHETEAAESPGWEHVAVAAGPHFATGPDPLFARIFILATSVNFFPAALGGEPLEVFLIGVCHFALIYRVRKAQTFVQAQREADLRTFEAVRASRSHSPAGSSGLPPDTARPTE